MVENLAVLIKHPRLNPLLIWLGWLFIIIVIVAPRIFDLDVFYARDELTNWGWANDFTRAIWAGHPAQTLTGSNHPGIPLFWVQTLLLTFKYSLPTLFQQTMIPVEQLSQNHSLALLAERRLGAGLLVSGQLIAAVWLVRRLFGWRVTLLAAILLGLDPFSLSEARLLRFEMISALFACLGVLLFFHYLRHHQRLSLLLSGCMAGLAVSSKVSAGLFVPYFGLLLILDAWRSPASTIAPPEKRARNWPDKVRRLSTTSLIWAAAAAGVFWLIWPAMWVRPFEASQYLFLRGLSQVSDDSVWHGPVFFWGQLHPGGDPGPFFYPVVLAFRTTPLVWVGCIAALLAVVRVIWRRISPLNVSAPPAAVSATLWGWPWFAGTMALLAAGIIIVILEQTASISKVDRYLILIFPLLNILSALGLTILIKYASRLTLHVSRFTFHASRFTLHPPHSPPALLPIISIILILLAQLSLTLPTHPYYFTYWNPWAGGGRAAMQTLPIGAGEGVDLAMTYLNRQPGAAEKTLVCGGSRPWCSGVFQGQTLRSATYADGSWVKADYVSFYISQLQRQDYPQEVVDFFSRRPPFYQVELQDVAYMSVYAVPKIAHFAGPANDLAGLARLLGYNLSASAESSPEVTVKTGAALEPTVWWTNLGAGLDNLVLRLIDETGYEWSRARIVPLPEYAAIPPTQRAIVAGTARLTIPPGTPPGLYFLRMGVTAPGENRLLGEFKLPAEADNLIVSSGQRLTAAAQVAISHPVNQPLAPDVTLLGYDRPDQALTPLAPTWLTLYWQATAPPADYLVTLRLLDSAGNEATRWQGQPGHGHYPTATWQSGEIVKDVWALQVPQDTPIGNYSLEISLSNPNQSKIQNLKPKIENLEVWPQPVGYDVPAMQTQLGFDFGDRLTLLGYDLYFDVNSSGGGFLAPNFYWQSRTNFEETFDLGLALRAVETGQVVKTWRVPLGNAEPKALWKAGEVINAGYRFETGAMTGGRYQLDVTLLNRATGQPELAHLGDGAAVDFVRLEDIQAKIVVRTVK